MCECVCVCIHTHSPLSLLFHPNSFLPEDYFPDNPKTGCDIKSAEVKSKAKNTERRAYLFWLSVSNHIHNIHLFQRPHNRYFWKDKSVKGGGGNLTLDCKQGNCIVVLPGICWWTKYSLNKIKAIRRVQREDSGKEEGDGQQGKGLTSRGQ